MCEVQSDKATIEISSPYAGGCGEGGSSFHAAVLARCCSQQLCDAAACKVTMHRPT